MGNEIDGKFIIKSEQGISQAIRDELGLSDEQNKKLGLSVWTQILNCVEQENIKREKGDEIYTGGSDIKGDYRTNFVVKADQLIELSAKTWNKIVDLVNNKLGTNIGKVEQEEGDPASAGEKGGDSQEEEELVNTAIINDGEDHSAIEGEKPEDLTSDEIKILNRKVYTGTFPRKDEIVHMRGGRYYKNKFLIEEHDPNDKLILKIDREDDGSIKSIIKYQYDEQGKNISMISYDANGKVKEKWVSTDFSSDYYDDKYVYDDKGNVKEKCVYDDKGNEKEKYVYENDKVKEKWVNRDPSNGRYDEKYVYENGKVKEKWVNTNFSNNYFEEKYVFDENGNVKKYNWDEKAKSWVEDEDS